MKFLILFFLTFSANAEFTIVHYNIKELTSKKIEDAKNVQFQKLQEAMGFFKYQIMSLNEIQYDMKKGENLKKIASKLELKKWNDVFYPANTGKNAKNGKPDLVNFGLFPGQYSTGMLTKYKIKSVKEFHDLKWRDFHSGRDITPYKMKNGKPFPADMELFDKNFTDVTLVIEGHDVHVILFHTVPSYHFGNKNSLNYLRNADQLRFLEWYLSGRTDIAVSKKVGIEPLKKGSTFIAVGDWNTDIGSTTNPGTLVLKRILKLHKPWMDVKKLKNTHEADGFAAHPFKMKLDYIVMSHDLHVKFSGVWSPDSKWTDLGCKKKPTSAPGEKMVLVEYRRGKKDCFAGVSDEYHLLKQVSDHFPLWATLTFDDKELDKPSK